MLKYSDYKTSQKYWAETH